MDEYIDREKEEAVCALNKAITGYEGRIPCVPGDTIYYIQAPWEQCRYYKLRMYTVSHLIIRKEGISVMVHEITNPGMCLCHGEDFGRIAFTDKKEANKRLDELNKGR